ncbi:CIC11C00000002544 [Sungouiella intermedia]|uniref:CIC11C00000002544 n=1 Tax=Sungouiella intermedia TaxID=45354 RepID=A0A1L0BEH2_9ASCO|nr:CIC11C00000002544 [[Candida] intermedia]
MSYLPIGKDTGDHNVQGNPDMELREQDRWLPIANVARLMKNTLPTSAKVSKDAKECMQECVSEFISFITSEASDRCLREKRKTINGEDILYSMHDLGFENYAEVLKIYLAKYREQQALKQERGETRSSKKLAKKPRNASPTDLHDLNPELDDDYIKGEELTEDHVGNAQQLDQLAYSASPQGKDVHSPDYFHQYESNESEGNPQMANLVDEQHMKHGLDVHVDNLDVDGRYGDFLHEDNDDLKNGKKEHMNDLEKLGSDDADIDNLTTGITNRSYY